MENFIETIIIIYNVKGGNIMYDSIVIGSGFAGSVIARELAERGKEKVLVIEKRNHIAGNCYDEKEEHDIVIHKYGPHIFHTNSDTLTRFPVQIHSPEAQLPPHPCRSCPSCPV